MDRRLFIVIAVVGFHVLGLWALQTGLLRRAVELVVPVQVMAEFIELPQPQVTPTPPPPQPRPTAVPKKVTPPAPKPAPQPVAMVDPTPSPTAATGTTEPQPPAPPPQTPMVVAEPAPPAPPKVELPSSSADYLNNAPPPYPPLSKRLGEQGKVIVRAFIEVNGTASKAEIRTSSGYERLDQTALQTVLKWRYIPGKRAGVPEAMWFNIPINFVLE
ncbi:energy transducer TonB [Hydrogenophaga sp. ZJX-1]|uniref:energy transducer TonB n=1 Tax=Hydrogenophaga sp. ZJX-1 TaxID=3404778 RepID=UPI003B27EFEC